MHQKLRMPDGTTITIEMNSAQKIILDKGLGPGGDVQTYHTQNAMNHMLKYMPFRSGMLKKITIAQTNINVPEIVTDTPYARYLYHGVKMVNAKTGKGPGVIPGVGPRWRKGTTLVPTAEPLNFNRKLPTAGPYWDRRMVAAEGKQIAEELQGYINQKGEHT